jgi:hypothetical protein
MSVRATWGWPSLVRCCRQTRWSARHSDSTRPQSASRRADDRTARRRGLKPSAPADLRRRRHTLGRRRIERPAKATRPPFLVRRDPRQRLIARRRKRMLENIGKYKMHGQNIKIYRGNFRNVKIGRRLYCWCHPMRSRMSLPAVPTAISAVLAAL